MRRASPANDVALGRHLAADLFRYSGPYVLFTAGKAPRRRVIGVDLNLLESALSASTLRSEQNGYLDSCTPSCVAEVVLLRGLVVQLAEGRSLLVRVRTW